jgi:hypothetical protein
MITFNQQIFQNRQDLHFHSHEATQLNGFMENPPKNDDLGLLF